MRPLEGGWGQWHDDLGAAGRAGGRGGKEGAFPDPLRVDPRQRFALRPAASRTAIEDIPVVLSHLVFGTLSWQP